MYTYKYIHIHVHVTHTSTYTYMYIHIHVHVHIQVHTHTCTHTHHNWGEPEQFSVCIYACIVCDFICSIKPRMKFNFLLTTLDVYENG